MSINKEKLEKCLKLCKEHGEEKNCSCYITLGYSWDGEESVGLIINDDLVVEFEVPFDDGIEEIIEYFTR